MKRVEIAGSFSAVLKKGDADAGVCLIKVCDLEGHATIYNQIRNTQGDIAWLSKGPLKECIIDEELAKISNWKSEKPITNTCQQHRPNDIF